MNTAATIGLQLGAAGLAALCVWGLVEIYALRDHARGALDRRPKGRPEHDQLISGHSAGGIFRHDQEIAAGRIGNTVKALDEVMAKKAPARCLRDRKAAPARSPSRPPNASILVGGREGERAGATCPGPEGCAWAGIRFVAALTRCFGIAFRTAPRGLPRPKRNRTDRILTGHALGPIGHAHRPGGPGPGLHRLRGRAVRPLQLGVPARSTG